MPNHSSIGLDVEIVRLMIARRYTTDDRPSWCLVLSLIKASLIDTSQFAPLRDKDVVIKNENVMRLV